MKSRGFPVGATWEYIAPNGAKGRVWLQERDQATKCEVWMYSYLSSTGDEHKQDWAPNKRVAVELCSIWFGYDLTQGLHKPPIARTRFKRVN